MRALLLGSNVPSGLVLSGSVNQAPGRTLRHRLCMRAPFPGQLGPSAKVDSVLAYRVSPGKGCINSLQCQCQCLSLISTSEGFVACMVGDFCSFVTPSHSLKILGFWNGNAR